VLLQATFLASLAQDPPSSMLPTDPAFTPAGQPSVALPLKAPAPPLKAPAPPMNTHSSALNTNGHPSMALPSKAAATDLPAAAGLGLSQVDLPHTEIKSPGDAPSVFSHSTRPLSRLPRRVREAARVEPISLEHIVQPNAMPAAASMPGLPSLGEATAEVAPTPSSKKSGKPPRHPRIKALVAGRGKGLPRQPPTVTPIKTPAPAPTGSSVGAVMGEPMTPGPVLGSPSTRAEVDPSEQPTPGTPVGWPDSFTHCV